MALILSNKSYHMGFRDVICDILFNAYTYGGEEFVAADVSMAHIAKVYVEPVKGYTFEFDYSNNKIKVFKNAPPIIIEEVQTISADDEITLNYPAAAILNMASATATQLLIEPSDTLTNNEVQLAAAMTAGERPTFAFDSGTTGDIKTTYITQAWQEVWVNRTVSQGVDTAAHRADTGETLCFVESMVSKATGTVVSSRPKYLGLGDTPNSTLECEVDFTDGEKGDRTTFTFNTGDAITSIIYTGIILPASGFLYERFIEDEHSTVSSQTGYSTFPILFQAICGQIQDYHTGAWRDPHFLMMPSGDDCATTTGECAIDWHLIKDLAGTQIITNDGTTDSLSLSYVKGLMSEIPGLVPLEVPDGTDLSALSGVKAHILGR